MPASKSPQPSASPTSDWSSSSSTSTVGVQLTQQNSGLLWNGSSYVAVPSSGAFLDNNVVDMLSTLNFYPVTFPSDEQHTSTNGYDVDFLSMSSIYAFIL